ncbi:MAG: hypothetical protein U5K54_24030 [Cytophagales bacterium]|nr:hypothetical protein [Cytophagales bacterium]
MLVLGITLSGCFQSDYTRLVKSELAKGVRYDSLLLGIRFGDSRDDFYGKCFDLNKQQLVREGPGNTAVQYMFTDSTVHAKPTEIRLLFMPKYDEKNIITEMNMEFSYRGWTPWVPELQSDTLKVKTMEILMEWYKGNEFVIAHVQDTEQFVKLDGNRRVVIYKLDPERVVVKVQDILHPSVQHSITTGE